jgi:hypothetical protein
MDPKNSQSKTTGTRQRKGGRALKEAKTILLGARVTPSELKAWESRFVKTGTHRSEIVRGMLKVGKVRKRRGAISNEALWDYARAMLIRGSLSNIKLLLEAIGELPIDARVEGYRNAAKCVTAEVKLIERELDALQLRGGFTSNNPALHQGADWQGYFEEAADASEELG